MTGIRSQTQHHARSLRGLTRVLDKTERGCKTDPKPKGTEEATNIDRRQLILPALAFGLLSVAGVSMVPALAASADEEAVAKNVEAFRAAQFAADAKAFDALCAAELSYSHIQRQGRGQGDLYRQLNQRKVEVSGAGISGHHDSRGRTRSDRPLPLGGRTTGHGRWQENRHQSPHPDELAKTGRGLETPVPIGHRAVIAAVVAGESGDPVIRARG
jgi:hypothetical protein